MAIDVVTRVSEKCLTVVADEGHAEIDSLHLKGPALEAVSGNARWQIGVLKPSMQSEAEACEFAAVVTMGLDFVKSSKRVTLHKA